MPEATLVRVETEMMVRDARAVAFWVVVTDDPNEAAREFAQAIRVTPEHMSRLEAGDKILAPQSEMLVRIYTFVATLPFTSRKEAEALKVAELVANLFCDLSIKPCRLIEDKVVLVLTRGRRVTPAGDAGPDDNGLWDDEVPSKVA